MADEELRRQIRQMVAASLVVEEADDRLAFRHALTREAVYSTLLRSERRRFHQIVAEAMHQGALAHGDTADALLAELAYHYYEAEAWAEALDFAKRAGTRSLAVSAAREAAGYFTRALDAAEHLGIRNRSDLLHARGRALEALGEFDPAHADYEAERARAREEGDGPGEWQALIDLGFLWAGRDYHQTGNFFRQALAHARALHNPNTEAHSLNRLGNWLANTGLPADGIAMQTEALAVFRACGDRAGEAETLDLLCFAHATDGDLVRAVAIGAAAVELFRTLDDQTGLLRALSMQLACKGPGLTETSYSMLGVQAAIAHDAVEVTGLARRLGAPADIAFTGVSLTPQMACYGEFGQALALAHEALRIARSIAHRQWTAGMQCVLGYTYYWLLESGRAFDELLPALTLARGLGSAWWIGNTTTYLALVCIQQGELARAEETLAAAFAPDQTPHSLQERRMLWAWGELALARGEPSRALALAEQLLASAVSPADAAPQAIPCLWKLKGGALCALGRWEEAGEAFERAKSGAVERGMRPLLWQIHGSLARVHAQQSRPAQAARELAAAHAVVAGLAASIDELPQRERFVRAAEAALARAPIGGDVASARG